MTVTCELLRRVSFLSQIEAPALEVLAKRLPERHVRKGCRLFGEGEPCPGFWIVNQGSVNIYKIAEDGRMQILETCHAGEVFGLVSAIDGGDYPASAETREDSVLVFFPREDLMTAIRTVPQTGLSLARFCAERLRRLTTQVASVSLCPVKSRVAAHILEEARARGIEAPDGTIAVDLEGRQQEVARRIGTVREVLARALRGLANEGVIEHRREHVIVRDMAALRRIAQV
jgi:CRP/FNR family transcriptional regulator, cyclic AMP receptor protein